MRWERFCWIFVACGVATCGLALGDWKEDLARSGIPAKDIEAIERSERLAREKFLGAERFARLPRAEQETQFAEFYKTSAPKVNHFAIGILSSCPKNLLDRERGLGDMGGSPEQRWTEQLREAAKTMAPEAMADKLKTRMYLDIATLLRTKEVLQSFPKLLTQAVSEDLDSKQPESFRRGNTIAAELQLTEFSPKLAALYLSRDNERSVIARNTIISMRDPAAANLILAAVKKDPRTVERDDSLLQSLLWGKAAPDELVGMLDGKEAGVRDAAATAIAECDDPRLKPYILKLATGSEKAQLAAITMAQRLTWNDYGSVRKDLVPLLSSEDHDVRMAAIRCFARQKDLDCGKPIVQMLRTKDVPENDKTIVMQAIGALANRSFNYNMHQWGETGNEKAIADFQAWLANPTR